MRLTRVFLDINMGRAFDGLRAIAKEQKHKLGPDSTVLFLNRKRNAFKVVVNDTYIVYYRSAKRINLNALAYLPQTFGGSELEMRAGIREALEKELSPEINRLATTSGGRDAT